MRKFFTPIAAFLGAMTFAGVANATSHGAMPSALTLLERIQWEVEHFLLHISLTFDAVVLLLSAPQFAWAMLADQLACAPASLLASFFFASAGSSLLTLLAVISFCAAVVVWLGRLCFRVSPRARSFL